MEFESESSSKEDESTEEADVQLSSAGKKRMLRVKFGQKVGGESIEEMLRDVRKRNQRFNWLCYSP